MTRIIGGTAGGRRLRTPAGSATRPTSDRVREALFSALEARTGTIAGLRFLDLYAGSGAVGLEALSRGAAAATLVERDVRTARLVQENARTLGLPAEVVAQPVERFVAAQARTAYDLVYVDPPYDLEGDAVDEVLAALSANGWVADRADVVVERSARSVSVKAPSGLAAERSKRYGETVLWFLTTASDDAEE